MFTWLNTWLKSLRFRSYSFDPTNPTPLAKKKIGISSTPVKLANYYTWFERQGVVDEVELISLSYIEGSREDFLKCDGFILTGGDDVSPELYGGAVDYENRPPSFDRKRDEFEKRILLNSLAYGKPLLGICRGLQLVNVFFGGKLIQDLGTGNHHHKAADGIDKQHAITIGADTLLAGLVSSIAGVVNSAHHQAVDATCIGKGLMPNAWSATDTTVIEGLEFGDKTDKPFMLCVQWHPERIEDATNQMTRNILKGFLQAITTYQTENANYKSRY